jgi:hypothetical protein
LAELYQISKATLLTSEETSNAERIPLEIINGLIMEIPEVLLDIDLELTEKEYRAFTDILRQYLHAKGVNFKEEYHS